MVWITMEILRAKLHFTLRRLFYFSYKYVQKWFKELYFFCLILNIQLMSEFLIEAISQNSRLHKYTLK
jgi:hypothetical protein